MKTTTIITVLALLTAGAALAGVELTAEALTEVRTTNAEGEEVISLVKAEKVVPGDEVIYAIHFVNRGPAAADDVVITNPIPQHMVFTNVELTPRGATVEMSADGGAEYGQPGRITVADAGGGARPADASDFTHVRWTFQEPLEPGAEGSVSFRARLQ
jgi:uncharacterized repeat protein (TIGR01451 family)